MTKTDLQRALAAETKRADDLQAQVTKLENRIAAQRRRLRDAQEARKEVVSATATVDRAFLAANRLLEDAGGSTSIALGVVYERLLASKCVVPSVLQYEMGLGRRLELQRRTTNANTVVN